MKRPIGGRLHLVAAAARLEAGVRAVAVEVLPDSPDEPDHRLEELLVVLQPGRERAVVDARARRSAGSRCNWQRLNASRTGRKSTWPVGELGEVGDRRLELVDEALELGRAQQRARLVDPRERRPRSWPASRGRPGSSRAPTRAWAGTPRSGCRAPGSPPRAPAAARGSSRAGSSSSSASAPIVMLKFVIRSLRLPSLASRAPRRPSAGRRSASTGRAARCRAGPGSRSPRRAARSAEYSSESFSALPAVSPFMSGVLVGVLAGQRLAVERVAEAHQQLLEVLAGVGLERAEHLVELHRRRGLRRRDRVVRRRARARPACPAGCRRRGCPRGRCAGGP